MRVSLALLTTLCCLLPVRIADAKEAPARDLAKFIAHSRAQLEQHEALALSGRHPIRDWPRSHWIERAPEKALFLNGVETLSVAEATALARFEGERIFLPDLKALDAAVADALRRGPASLFLDGLTKLDAPSARALVQSRGDVLSLRGLTSITPDLARILASYAESLDLSGVKTLDLDSAKALAAWDGWGESVELTLGVDALTPDVANALTAVGGWALALDHLKELTPEIARILGRLDIARLSLDGLSSVSPEVAAIIATWDQKFLTMGGFTEIDPAIRAQIEAGSEIVSFRGLKAAR